MPARASLFTGLMPRDHGVRTNGITLDPSLPTLPAGERRDSPVSAVDFAPTVLDFCDVPVPEGRAPPERKTAQKPRVAGSLAPPAADG